MQTIRELKAQLKPLIDNWFMVNDKFLFWKEYSFEQMWEGRTLQITMKNIYFDARTKRYKTTNSKIVSRAFAKMVRELWAEILKPPFTAELWYEDSLLWLFKHYPYGEGDFTNCVLVNGKGRVIGIQYNGCKYTRFIYSDIPNPPDFIIINNKKKLDGKYYSRDTEKLLMVAKKAITI